MLDYLQAMTGRHVTVGEICAYLQAQGSPIGQATVYRHLECMVNEGIVNKYMIDGTSPACFEYIGSACHEDPESCFHCKCEICGRLFHVHCRELEGIGEHLYEHHHFRLNPYRTVFYGVCADCRGEYGREDFHSAAGSDGIRGTCRREGGCENFHSAAGSDGVRGTCHGASDWDGVSENCHGTAGSDGVCETCNETAGGNRSNKTYSENQKGESGWRC